ncbi:MAG: HAMP domain-containing sensor histidine kinase [Bacteroidota bacterium]
MKNSTITLVLFLGAIIISGMIAMQSYWVISTWNINEEEFNKKVRYALHNAATSLVELNGASLPPRNVIKQRTSNYYVVNIEAEIDANFLAYFLQKEFEALALNVDFEYAVFDCTTDEMVYGNYYSYSDKKKEDAKSGSLPKYEEFTYYFGVKFPNRSGFLLGKMQLAILLTAVLVITFIFFSYVVWVIFRQKRLSEMQKDFINNMTHEFKTPISTIKISADVFSNHPTVKQDERLSKYATIIQEQNQRLNRQVEKVLQLAKVERQNFELKKEVVSLSAILQGVVDSVSLRIEKLGGKLDYQLPSSSLAILADRLHLTNILHNLVDNAVKYCKGQPSVSLTTNTHNQQIELCVKDEGIGIAKEHQNRIFDKFYRVPTGNIHNVKGFGLGLFYVKSICDAHGWRIKLKSEPHSGTSISISIPLADGANPKTN